MPHYPDFFLLLLTKWELRDNALLRIDDSADSVLSTLDYGNCPGISNLMEAN